MYRHLYSLGIKGYGLAISIASLFNPKAQKWIRGRRNWEQDLQSSPLEVGNTVWFHAASLGEAEQGVPVIMSLRKEFPNYKILLTFFSPSGMDNFKALELVDHIAYLPLDTSGNAATFLDLVRPKLAFFIKYEIWPNFFRHIQKREIPLVIAPAIFRENHFYFKSPHKEFFLPLLKKVDRIMVQDENSQKLLKRNGIESTVCGDTRFERVLQNVTAPFENDILKNFSKDHFTLVGGSTWSPGEEMLNAVLKDHDKLRTIVAPHDISPANIKRLQELFGPTAFAYSQVDVPPAGSRVCIIDNIGMLSRLYRYGQVAYIGGAFGKGIHNSLEAAAYGLPLFFGPNHQSFIEPSEMLEAGFAFEVKSESDLKRGLLPLIEHEEKLRELNALAADYVKHKAGATERILEQLKPLLDRD